MVEVAEHYSSVESRLSSELKEPADDMAAVLNNDDDEEDFSGLPELCDNEQAAAAAKTRDVNSQDKAEADDFAAEGAEDHSSQLGEWEDVLGSGR